MKCYIDIRQIGLEHYQHIVETFSNLLFTNIRSESFDADIIMGYPENYGKEALTKYKNLRWIHLLTAGYETMDVSAVLEKNILLTNSKGVFSSTMAEDVICKMLLLNRNVPQYLDFMKKKMWNPTRNELEIRGSTVGIIGAGSIGHELAKRLKAFDVRVIGYRRTPGKSSWFDEIKTDKEGLQSLLQESDYVVISIPLTESTKHLIHAGNIGLMKSSAVLINVARGDIIDQKALIDAMSNKKLRGAALDVTSPEPLPSDSPLWTMDNVFISPHCSVVSPMLYSRMTELAIENMNRFLSGKKVLNPILK